MAHNFEILFEVIYLHEINLLHSIKEGVFGDLMFVYENNKFV